MFLINTQGDILEEIAIAVNGILGGLRSGSSILPLHPARMFRGFAPDDAARRRVYIVVSFSYSNR